MWYATFYDRNDKNYVDCKETFKWGSLYTGWDKLLDMY